VIPTSPRARGRKHGSAVAADLVLWKNWLGQLTNAVTTVMVYREIWGMMVAAIDANPTIPRTLAMDYLAGTEVKVRLSLSAGLSTATLT